MNEEWIWIVWYEWLYEVSNFWRVKTLWNWNSNVSRKQRIIKPQKRWNYLFIRLSKEWISKSFSIHRLVCFHFNSWFNDIRNQVNHIDWNKYNNHYMNLEWVSASENQLHSNHILWNKWNIWLMSKWKLWILNHNSKPVIQFNIYWLIIKKWDSIKDAERWLWIPNPNISKVCKWIRNTAWWFKWKYLEIKI